jgi:hypothetical protein
MNLLTKATIALGIIISLYGLPVAAKADCSPNQAGPVARPVSCQVGIVTYWCSTAQECQIAQDPALNNPPVQGEIGAFSDMFQDVNKHLIANNRVASPNNFIGNMINTLMPFIFVIGGIGLLIMLMSGGFQIMTAVQDPARADEGKQRIVAALVGFFILFASYWIVQALEIIFGITILG